MVLPVLFEPVNVSDVRDVVFIVDVLLSTLVLVVLVRVFISVVLRVICPFEFGFRRDVRLSYTALSVVFLTPVFAEELILRVPVVLVMVRVFPVPPIAV